MNSELEVTLHALNEFLKIGISGAVAALSIMFALRKDKQKDEAEARCLVLTNDKASLTKDLMAAHAREVSVLYNRMLTSTLSQNEKYRDLVVELNGTVELLADREAAEVIAYSNPPPEADPPAGLLPEGGDR